MQTIKNRSIAGTAALIATAFTLALATAPARAEAVSVPVAYGDLDIHSAAGATELQARIARAARQICGEGNLANWAEVATCHRNAMQAAKAQVAQKIERANVQLASR